MIVEAEKYATLEEQETLDGVKRYIKELREE
jgi:hypothetical protein